VSYAFDALNRLTAASGGGTAAQYQYDGDGNRISQQAGASSYQYTVDVVRRNPAVLNENGSDGNIDFQHGLTILSGSSTTLEQFYQSDGVGSTADVTDATDTLKASYTYDPWGKLLNPMDPLGTKDKFKFTGEALDPQTGLYYLHARYLDPQVGGFISKDPFPGLATAPRSTNRYAYALNNPVNLVDPSGLAAEPRASDAGTALWPSIINTNSLTPSTNSSNAYPQPLSFSPLGNEVVDTGNYLVGLVGGPLANVSAGYGLGKDISDGNLWGSIADVVGLIPLVGPWIIGTGQWVYNTYQNFLDIGAVVTDGTAYMNGVNMSSPITPQQVGAPSASGSTPDWSNYQ
jgi:RHS repeat-associated protein